MLLSKLYSVTSTFSLYRKNLGVSQNRGVSTKMDGENNGKPYFLIDDLGGKPPYFWKHPSVKIGFGMNQRQARGGGRRVSPHLIWSSRIQTGADQGEADVELLGWEDKRPF